MNVLSNPVKSFKVPNSESKIMGALYLLENFFVADDIIPTIYQGSTIIKRIGDLTKENEAIIAQIKAMKFLNENWDGEGAMMIPENTVNRTIELVKLINKFDTNVYLASPGPNQEVMLMLKNESKEIELIIYPDREKYVKFNGNEFVEQDNFQNQDVESILEWISNNE